jgi:hypothetical protein
MMRERAFRLDILVFGYDSDCNEAQIISIELLQTATRHGHGWFQPITEIWNRPSSALPADATVTSTIFSGLQMMTMMNLAHRLYTKCTTCIESI